jgi:hypothetical protein
MHIKRAKGDLLEETIRMRKGKNILERALTFILTIARIFDTDWQVPPKPRLAGEVKGHNEK